MKNKIIYILIIASATFGLYKYLDSQYYLEHRIEKVCGRNYNCKCTMLVCGYAMDDKSICHKMLKAIEKGNRIMVESVFDENKPLWISATDICKKD